MSLRSRGFQRWRIASVSLLLWAAGAARGEPAAPVAVTSLSEPPSVRAVFAWPTPGAVLVPRGDPLTIWGTVEGDVSSADLSVGFGRVPNHFDPIPFAASIPIFDGALAHWDATLLDDGPYLLRLDVRGRNGSRVVEFLPVSLERNPPTRLSSPGPDASAPVISGNLVAWQSSRPLGGVDLGLEIFVRDWDSGAEWRPVTGPGAQRQPRLSRGRLAWLDPRNHVVEFRTCRLESRRDPCRDELVVTGYDWREGLAIAGELLVWTEYARHAWRLRGCIWRGDRCLELALPTPSPHQRAPILSRSRLSWKDMSAPPRLLTCAGLPRICRPVPVQTATQPDVIAGSGRLFAWTSANGGFNETLFACRMEDDGTCPTLQLGQLGSEPNVVVSDGRIAWSAPGPGGDSDVFVCEYDRVTGLCPVQRITGSAAEQRRPAISGKRVVWEDDRDGAVAVFGLELPSLARLADRRTSVGRAVRIVARGRDRADGGLALSASFADGTPLAERDAALQSQGDGSAVLTWTPSAADVGVHIVTFVGRAAGGLATRRSVRITVDASPRAEAPPGSS